MLRESIIGTSLPLLAIAASGLPLILSGCGADNTAVPDTGSTPDSGLDEWDASSPRRDTGSMPDSTPPSDTGPNDAGPNDTGPNDTGPHDTGPNDTGPHDTGPHDTGPNDTGPNDTGPHVCIPSASNIAISEVLVASQSGAGDLGEWFEIKNLGSCTVELAGLVLEGTDAHLTAAMYSVPSGLLAAGSRYVFAQSSSLANNHGLEFDQTYESSGIAFNNGGDSITLRYMGTVVDQLSWGASDHRPGAARELDRDTMHGGGSLGGSVWCDATNVYSSEGGLEYRGTPGVQNEGCP